MELKLAQEFGGGIRGGQLAARQETAVGCTMHFQKNSLRCECTGILPSKAIVLPGNACGEPGPGLGWKDVVRHERGTYMKRSFGARLAAVLLVAGFAASLAVGTASAQQTPAELKFKVGDAAPDFTLHYFDGSDLKDVKLSDYRGKKNVVLAFYIFAFTGG